MQCLCYCGFYIKRASLILFMTRGKIIVVAIIRGSEIRKSSMLVIITKFILENMIIQEPDAEGMSTITSEIGFTVGAGIKAIWKGKLITIIIFTEFTRISTSMGTVRTQVSCSKWIRREVMITMLAITDAGKEREAIGRLSRMTED